MTTTRANLADLARLADPDFYVGDPHPVYARLRGEEQLVRGLVVGAVEAIEPKQPVDVVEALSVPTSLNVISALLGVPRSDWANFKRWTDDLSGHLDAVPGSEQESRMRLGMEEM